VKVLFDECMPQPLRRLLAEFEISTAQEIGWGRVKNGELLRRADVAQTESDSVLLFRKSSDLRAVRFCM